MLKRITALFCACVLLLCCTGCKKLSLENMDMPELPQFNNRSTLTGKVDSVNGHTCTVTVTEGDHHYKEDDQVIVAYSLVDGNQTVKPGCQVRFSYEYTKNVSEKGNDPLITVGTVAVLP